MDQPPLCLNCVQPMIEVGPIRQDIVRTLHESGGGYVDRPYTVKLYQCPECKEVKIQ